MLSWEYFLKVYAMCDVCPKDSLGDVQGDYTKLFL